MQVLYATGQNVSLAVLFQGAALAGPFYIGLGTGAIPDLRTDTLADVTEVTGTGYARIPVDRSDDPDDGWTVVDNVASTPTLTFTNSGVDPEVAWTDIDYLFLTMSPTGTTAPTTLFGTIEVDTVELFGGESESFVFNFSLYDVAADLD